MNEWYRRPGNAERVRERMRAYNEAHPDTRSYRRPAEEKLRARNAINHAIASGQIARQGCEVCGEADAQAHHDDYSKPLDVRWLCRRHHGEVHRTVAA